MIKFLPDDINIEDVLAHFPKESYLVYIDGLHKRNAYQDIISCDQTQNGKLEFHIGRNSLYNSLPEYMFHPINRFDNIPERERKELFATECAKQEQEKEYAHKFFSPIDVLLLDIKTKVKERINQFASSNVIMQEIIGDGITAEQKKNRFIKQTIPFLPNCKRIRGNQTLITLLLRKILSEEGIICNKASTQHNVVDKNPRYNEKIVDAPLENTYLGNEFNEDITTYTIQYWSDNECAEHFDLFLAELEEFRLFFKDFFLSIEDELIFNVVAEYSPVILPEDDTYYYLNYNTNL
ncbi:MAG: hypothetical protein J6V55_02340 [Alistipes sp.]|nr:hypothetical protein [Alistipes sp.]